MKVSAALQQAALEGIRGRRRSGNLRIIDLAERSQVNVVLLRSWERGLVLPTLPELAPVARQLQCAPELLLAELCELAKSGVRGEGYVTALPSGSEVVARSVEPPTGRLRVLDLFCGSGGFSFGLETSEAFTTTAGIDLLSDRARTYSANHPSAVTIASDIRTFPVDDLRSAALSPDVVVGGPPCQGFSSIRPFRDRGRGDPRNNLFEEFVLVVEAIQPEWFVLENVVGLLTHQKGATLKALLAAFAQIGYTVEWCILNAAHYGLPQTRERVVVVGSRRGKRFRFPEPTHAIDHRSMAGTSAKRIRLDPLFTQDLKPAVTVMDAIGDLPAVRSGQSVDLYDDSLVASEYARLMRGNERTLTLHEATAHSPKMMEIIRLAGSNRAALPAGMTTSGFSSCYSRLDADKPSVTITVNFVHASSNKCIHPVQDRALTPREGARLQGFPDRFRFLGSRTQIVKQIGNAVPPVLGNAIARALAEQW